MLPAGGSWILSADSNRPLFIQEEFSEDARALAQAAREFMEGEVLRHSERIETQDLELTVRLMKQAGELGLLGPDVPEADGGLDLDMATSCLVAERMSVQGSFAVSVGAHTCIGSLPLAWFGTPEQRKRYLPRLTSGECIGAFSLSEADYGSDALGAATRAVYEAATDSYVLNGVKMWTSNAGFADLFTVFAQVDLGDGGGSGRTFSAFLVERTFPGVSIGREEYKLGIKGSSTCRVLLEDVRVPAENLLHAVGRGHVVALNVLNAGRLKLAAGNLAPARDLIALSATYANQRVQGGRPISGYGLVQQKLAEQSIRLYGAESAVYRTAGWVADYQSAAERGDSTLPPSEYADLPPRARALEEYLVECAILKVAGSEMLGFVADEALQIHGGFGYTEEFPLARAYRDARINRIFEGTNEINRLAVTGTLLRRAPKARWPLAHAGAEIERELGGAPSLPSLDGLPLDRERALLDGLRKFFIATCGSAARDLGAAIAEEQEVLGALADFAIEFFCAESGVLRAVRLAETGSSRAEAAAELARACLGDAADRMETAAARVFARLYQGDEISTRLAVLRRFTRRVPVDGIGLRRKIAARVIELERYPLNP